MILVCDSSLNSVMSSFRHLTSRVQVGSPVTMRLVVVPPPVEEGKQIALINTNHADNVLLNIVLTHDLMCKRVVRVLNLLMVQLCNRPITPWVNRGTN